VKVLMISKQGDGLGVADRLTQEGHDVRVWTSNPKYAKDLQGIVSRIDTWRPSITWADFILADMVGFAHIQPVASRYGKPSLSLNAATEVLELDRLRALRTARAVGMRTPESWAYDNLTDARNARPDFPKMVKPSGNQGPEETRKVETRAQYDWALSQFKMDQGLLLQEVVDGIEISTEGWFNGSDWVTPFNHTFEEKKLMPGETGPGTGCMGNFVISAARDKLVQETLGLMTPFLSKAGYRGPIDVNCIVKEDAAYFLEFTARMGYDAIEALATGLREPLGSMLFEVATGIKKEMRLTKDYMVAVRLCAPPYPNAGASKADVPLEGIVPENRKYLFLTGVQRRGPLYVTSGSDGVIGKVTAIGRTPSEARSRAYRTLGNIKGIDLFYRPDIGVRVEKAMRQLREWGWIE